MTSSAIINISEVLTGDSCRDKIVDMGFWFDVPHITKMTLKALTEKGVAGVRLVITREIIDAILEG